MRTASKGLLIAIVLSIMATTCQPQAPQSSPQTDTKNSRPAKSIVYTNKRYRFKFRLPRSWKGYAIITGQWTGGPWGQPLPDDPAEMRIERGPIITIRHPLWIEENPRQDSPIMVFTLLQWQLVDKGIYSVSAAPNGPAETERNAKYVFALPARYNYTDAIGIEEVNDIMRNHPLHAF